LASILALFQSSFTPLSVAFKYHTLRFALLTLASSSGILRPEVPNGDPQFSKRLPGWPVAMEGWFATQKDSGPLLSVIPEVEKAGQTDK
jgi:hypothetical protein